jgi:molybdopterin-guanine dinucleotide biosynthesis protein B
MAHVIGFVGRSNSGKTTLIMKLIMILRSRGLRVGVIKHDAHGHYKADQHTDSSRFMDSGAEAVVLSGKAQVVRFEVPQVEHSLEQLLAGMPELDIILVEGYKKSGHPKIAVFLTMEQITILDQLQGDLLAVVSGCSYQNMNLDVPIFGIDDCLGVAEFICQQMKKGV